jgi:hypothetical protein
VSDEILLNFILGTQLLTINYNAVLRVFMDKIASFVFTLLALEVEVADFVGAERGLNPYLVVVELFQSKDSQSGRHN